MLDDTDMQILNLLKENSRIQWQEIGEKVHLTGQAVRNRINRMEKLDVIEGYTVKINSAMLGKKITAFITVFMKTADHAAFQKYIHNNLLITAANRISGEGCYLLKVTATEQKDLVELLDEILRFGNYKVNISIEKVK